MKQRQLQSYNDIHKKDEGAQRTQLLELAMSWDCIDVAKELILKNSLDNILVENVRLIFIFIFCFF
jgi:ankyrin repeat protein